MTAWSMLARLALKTTSRSVAEDFVEGEERSVCLDRRTGLRWAGPGRCREAGGDPFEREPGDEPLRRRGGARVLDGGAGVRQPVVKVAVELGAVSEGNRGHDSGEDDREQGKRGEDDAGAERAGLHRGASR